MGIVVERLRPSQCALLIALPMERRAFDEQRQNPARHEYAGRYLTWERYRRLMVDFLGPKVDQIVKLGCTVVYDATLDCLRRATRIPRVRAIAVMGHWTGTALEFADGTHPPQDIVPRLSEFDGLVDLCVCNPLDAARALDLANDRVLVRFSPQQTSPDVWIVFLLLLYKLLDSGRFSYLSALDQARRLLAVPLTEE